MEMYEISCTEEVEWEDFERNLRESVGCDLQRLGRLWSTIGIRGQLLQDRCTQVLEHYQDLAQRMYQEDSDLHHRLLLTVQTNTDTLREYCGETDLPMPQVDQGPPLMMKQYLAEKLEEVSLVRQSRLKRLEELRTLEGPLCLLLDVAPHPMPLQRPVPKQEYLDELDQHVGMLSAEKEQRQRKYCIYRSDILRLLQVLQKRPATLLEQEVATEAADAVAPAKLSQDKLNSMRNLIEQLKQEKDDSSRVLGELRQRLSFLWDLLQQDQEHRDTFVKENAHCGYRGLQAMREEILRCEELRKQNMGVYIGKLRQELIGWWDKCQASEEQKAEFNSHLTEENFTEQLLDLHEREVQQWRNLHHGFQALFSKAQKIGELFEKALDLQHRMTDPNRLHNRGGQLLQEERERKKLLLQIPKMEMDLVEMSGQYEAQTGRAFLVGGQRPQDYLRDRWGQLQQDKENEKKQRKQRKEIELSIATPRKRLAIEGVASGAPTPFKTPGCSIRGMTLRSPATATPLKSRRHIPESPAGPGKMMTGQKQIFCVNGPTDMTVSYKSFERPLNDPSRSGNKRSTMNNSTRKVLGSKITPLFTNSGEKRRRRSSARPHSNHRPRGAKSPAAATSTTTKGKMAATPIPFLY